MQANLCLGNFRLLTSAVVTFSLSVSAAIADINDISPVALRIDASNASGAGYIEIPRESLVEQPPGSGSFRLFQLVPLTITDTNSGAPVALVNNFTLTYDADPAVGLGFAVTAGNTDTLFTLTSGLLSFAAISPAVGTASAAFTVTDLTNNGATLTGNGPSGGAYLAQYNGFVPTGTTFAEQIPSVIAPIAGSNADGFNSPVTPIGVPVSNMSVQINFMLTAGDLASGTNNFQITPEPAALVLLSLSALLLRRR